MVFGFVCAYLNLIMNLYELLAILSSNSFMGSYANYEFDLLQRLNVLLITPALPY